MLADLFDGWLVDLDGVVYVDDRGVPGAADTVQRLRARGAAVVFVTDDPRGSQQDYADRLLGLGIPTGVDGIVTAGSATADYLVREQPVDRAVFVIEPPALKQEVARIRRRTVTGREALDAGVVVIGGHEGFDYNELAIGSIAARRGARVVATGRDANFPTADGPAPATGAVVAALEVASGVTATTVGNPSR